MTKKCTIFSGGEAVSAQCVAEYKSFIDDSLVISADKGYKLAQAVGVKSDIIILLKNLFLIISRSSPQKRTIPTLCLP